MELSPEALAIRRKKVAEYQRVWRKRNPDKVKAAAMRYWEKQAQKAREEAEVNEKK